LTANACSASVGVMTDLLPGHQRSFDDLGVPLHDVTFCVIDLETTGGAPDVDRITEVGAVRLRGGECLGTFQTLVNPGRAIPPSITVLTGITEAMVVPAPRIEAVLPSLLEFVGDAVIVGHNVRFDLGFLRAALDRAERPVLANRSVDTVALAKRLVRDEVPNLRLGTLASRLRLPHRPSHRALDDALATGDLLHVLLERAAGLGVLGLDDLLALPTMQGHAQAAKLPLTARLPREPGVYLFRDRTGRILYVGKATNLRQRVRSYFSGETRRKVGPLLRETHAIDHEVCHHPLEAAVREVRLIHQHAPRYNRHGRDWQKYVYLKLTTNEAFPRLSVVRAARLDGGCYLGPLPSTRFARRVAEAIESIVALRRCTARPPATPRSAPCAPAQLGVATCPCAGTITAAAYADLVGTVLRGLTTDPELLLEPLRSRMQALAGADRFEEAADVRDRAAALAGAIRRQRRLDGLRRAGRLVVDLPAGGAELRHGRLVRAWGPSGPGPEPTGTAPGAVAVAVAATLPAVGIPLELRDPLPRDQADELACVGAWLDHRAGEVRVRHCDGGLAMPLPALPTFVPAPGAVRPIPAQR
jgi:DNA polymerase III subunit epsilon